MLMEQEENESATGDETDYNRDVLLEKIVVGLNNDIKVALDQTDMTNPPADGMQHLPKNQN